MLAQSKDLAHKAPRPWPLGRSDGRSEAALDKAAAFATPPSAQMPERQNAAPAAADPKAEAPRGPPPFAARSPSFAAGRRGRGRASGARPRSRRVCTARSASAPCKQQAFLCSFSGPASLVRASEADMAGRRAPAAAPQLGDPAAEPRGGAPRGVQSRPACLGCRLGAVRLHGLCGEMTHLDSPRGALFTVHDFLFTARGFTHKTRYFVHSTRFSAHCFIQSKGSFTPRDLILSNVHNAGLVRCLHNTGFTHNTRDTPRNKPRRQATEQATATRTRPCSENREDWGGAVGARELSRASVSRGAANYRRNMP